MEQKILSAIVHSRQAFDTVKEVEGYNDFSDPARIIYDLVEDYYNNDPKISHVDTDILIKRIKREFPKQANSFEHLINDLTEDISSPNLMRELINLKKESLGRELSSILLTQKQTGAIELMEKYIHLQEHGIEKEDDDVLVAPSVKDLITKQSEENRIRLWPRALQENTGGALRGHNLLIFGRPEVGKSLFAINLAGGILFDGYKVLFIENEDPIDATMTRIICRLSGRTVFEIDKDPDGTEKLIKSRGYNNFILVSMPNGTFRQIDTLIGKYEPDVVFVNQLRNIYAGKLSKVEQMEKVAQQSREVGKRNNIVMIGVTQAGDSGKNKPALEMEDIDFSNTGMQGAMDLIIGIGSNPELESKGRRMITLPKNKLSGQHSHFPVTVDTKLNKVISI